MRLVISHSTRYQFSAPVAQGLQRLRVSPLATAGQVVLDWQVDLEGAVRQVEYRDANGNHVLLVSFAPGAQAVAIHCHGLVETADNAGVVGRHQGTMPLWHFREPTALTQPGPGVRALLTGIDRTAPPLDQLHALSAAVHAAIVWETGHTDAATSAEAALGLGRGVCQDHAHAFIAAARLLGFAARYVSGYLLVDGRDAQDAGHAWAEADVEGLGWVGFDAANAWCPDDRYVRVATGADYRAAAPVTGLAASGFHTGEPGEALEVTLAVTRQHVEQ